MLKLSLLAFIIFCTFSSYGQNCLEYPEIEGSFCVFCAPNGWSILSPSPDILESNGDYLNCTIENFSGESPAGGSMALFAAFSTTASESITTTISGLNTNQEYCFSLWWETITATGCGTWNEGKLLVVLNGENYIFEGADDWELIEICFIPDSSSINITLGAFPLPNTLVIVDSHCCDDVTTCCPIRLVAEEEYTLCPDNSFVLIANLDNSEGYVDIEWTSDPSNGISFLDETDILNPTFTFPESENFEGETYLFTLTVEDDNCVRIKEVIITVLASETPECNSTSSQNEIVENSIINIYPNPVYDQLTIEGLSSKIENYTIYNIYGKVVKSTKNISQSKILVQDLNAGTYLLSLDLNNGSSTVQKFIKI